MKKLIATIALCGLFAVNASALSFTCASAALKFDSTTLKSDATVTGYLIYLGSEESLSSSYALAADSTVSSIVSSIGTQAGDPKNKTSVAGKISSSFTFDYGSYNNGDTFAMLAVYTGAADGKTYYNLSGDVYTLSGITAENSSPEGASFSFSSSVAGESPSLAKGGGWTAVPEPSTAMLALAGLALLIKRRRA